MATADQLNWLSCAAQGAKLAGHVWPEMAACEAAVESGWGSSELAKDDNNLFGCKQHAHPLYGTISIPTREFINQSWVTQDAEWVKYPDLQSCFADRMNTLRSLSTTYPHYALALAADTPEGYVAEVSRSWSTDPHRAVNCIAIYDAHKPTLAEATFQV